MKRPILQIILLAFSFLGALATAAAQGSKEDYQRAEELRGLTENKVFRDRVSAEWIPDRPCFWYRIQTGPETHEFVWVNAEKAERRPAFDHQKLAEALAKASDEEVRGESLPFQTITFSPDEKTVSFRAFGKRWDFNSDDGTLTEQGANGEASVSTATVLDRIRPSRNRGGQTEMTFINQTDKPVRLFWIDLSGERVSYGEIAAGESRDQNTYAGHVWLVVDEEESPLELFEATEDGGEAYIDGENRPTLERRRRDRSGGRRGSSMSSPNGEWEAFIDGNNVSMRQLTGGEVFNLTDDGTEEDPYLERFTWSPDSTRLVAIQERKGENRQIQFVESAPDDQLQPKLHTLTYVKPGDVIDHPRPRLFDIGERKQIAIAEELLSNPWNLTDLRWLPDSSAFTFVYNQRGHQVLRMVAVDAKSGEARAVINEESSTFVDYAGKFFKRDLDETGEVVWMSERDGWNHLYLYDVASGEVKNQITKGEWVVRSVDRVDEEARQIWFRAGGIHSSQDPYHIHLCRVNFDGSGLKVLTHGDGTHQWEFSPDGNYLLARWSRVDHPPVTELRRADSGDLIMTLEEGNWNALLNSGWKMPERFVAKGRDGETDIYGVIFRPTSLDATKKYPIIEAIYAGPHDSFVPKSFSSYHGFQALAELGFIVVKMDGMGTSNRSKAFHDVCWQNLGDSGFPDRIQWIKAAAELYPYMDTTRVGIYGGSAGGQSTLRGLLMHGDFYKAGAADCGCHDNRMDKIWWNELWMGWPVGPHYEEQSNVTQAHRLTGKLLLTVGELDSNVDPASTMQVVDALIRADKDFELIVFPGANHGAGGSEYGRRRMNDFFVRSLHGREPRW